MEELIEQVRVLQKEPVAKIIEGRLREFERVGKQCSKRWFSELCFCILTANSKAVTALAIEKELGVNGFCTFSFERIRECIRDNKHRFHNNKAKYICEARDYLNIKEKVISITKEEGELKTRKWLAKSIKGLGYKEASHFLRNVGYRNVGIIDRHIISILGDHGVERPKVITEKTYLDIENKIKEIARKIAMSPARLDLYLWYIKTGKVLK